jgi:hypothetical protein
MPTIPRLAISNQKIARVTYDSRNLYVFVRAHDPHPDSVLSVLQRRDGMAPSDDIIIGIDSL